MSNSSTSLGEFTDATANVDTREPEDKTHLHELEGVDHNGWVWYPTPEIPGVHAQWIVDSVGRSSPYILAILPAYGSEVHSTTEDIYGATRSTFTEIRGYKLVHGRGDERDNTEVDRIMGKPGESPREVHNEHYDAIIEAAVEWLNNNDPESFQ